MKNETERIYRQRILEVLVHIQSRLDEPLPLEELAGIACFSPFHFHRIFKGLVGEPVGEHIRRLRLERATHALANSRRSVLDVALEAGFETHESFSRAFRKMFGRSPSSWRRRPDGSSPALPPRPSPILKPKLKGGTRMKIRIEKVPPRQVAFIRHIGPYEECGAAWERLCAWAGRRGLLGPETAAVGVSYDDPDVTPPAKIRYDACVTVGEDVEPEGEIGVRTLPGGEFAIAEHRGPYSGLKDAYSRIYGEWAPTSGRMVGNAPCYEVYLNDPARTPPERLLTEIYVPLEE